MHPPSGPPPEYGGSQPDYQLPPLPPGWGQPPPAPGYGPPPAQDPYAPPPAHDPYTAPPGYDPFAPPPGYDPFAPPPGHGPLPPPPGYGPPPPVPPDRPGTNGFALASLILGILAPCGGALLSVIFGFVALSQIKKRGQRGRGMAIGGIVITVVWLVVAAIVLVIAFVLAPEDEPDEPGPTRSLSPGACIEQVPETSTVFSLPEVACSDPHEAEVYAVFDLADGDWPGQDAVFTQAEDGCTVRLEASFPDAFADPAVDIYYLHPTESSWGTGDREVVCMAYYTDGPRTGSLLD